MLFDSSIEAYALLKKLMLPSFVYSMFQGPLGDDDSIYMSLGEIPLSMPDL